MAVVPAVPKPVTSTGVLEAVLEGGYYWSGGFPKTVITINFIGTTNSEPERTDVWEDDAFFAGMFAWERVANIDFIHVADRTTADIRITTGDGIAGGGGILADSETPEIALALSESRGDFQARQRYNINAVGWTDPGTDVGGYGFWTILHELGHALGLAHPFDNFPASATFNDALFSVMSYTLGSTTGRWYNTVPNNNYAYDLFGAQLVNTGYFATPSAIDIAAIQYLYGANLTFNAGPNTYFLPDSSINPDAVFWTTIWDTGGVDEIRYDGSGDSRISLEHFDIDGGIRPSNIQRWISQVEFTQGGLVIADDYLSTLDGDGRTGVVIENATGGLGNDSIRGNVVANVLVGRDGNDTVHGLDGADFLEGGVGNDLVLGGAGADTIEAGGGDDRINGDSDHDSIYGGAGSDVVSGGDGDDHLLGGSDNDRLGGGEGDDTILGELGSDVLHGQDGNDTVAGGDGDKARDVLVGGQGNDMFVFGAQIGVDVIQDFEPGVDVINLLARPGTSFAALMSDAITRPTDLVLRLPGADFILLHGIAKADLSSADFLLA